jgi:hypothetical protein
MFRYQFASVLEFALEATARALVSKLRERSLDHSLRIIELKRLTIIFCAFQNAFDSERRLIAARRTRAGTYRKPVRVSRRHVGGNE